MSDNQMFHPSEALAKETLIDKAGYDALYAESLADPEGFWAKQGQRIDWMSPYTEISDVSYDASDLHIRWYADGTLNASANCLDRHLESRGDQTAIIWGVTSRLTNATLPIANCMKKCVNLPMC